MQIVANGGTIGYDQVGHGPPLLLLHGAESDARMFQKLAPLLADQFTVISYDQRDTSRSVFGHAPYTMSDLGDDAAALIEALGHERAHVFGTSFGGMIAQATAINHPGRIDRLVLSSTAGRDDAAKQVKQARERAKLATEDNTVAQTADAATTARLFFSAASMESNPGLVDELSAIQTEREPQGAKRRTASISLTIDADLDSIDPARIRAKTLVIGGSEDRLIAPEAQIRLWQAIRGASIAILQDLGHVWPLEGPEFPAKVIAAFLTDGR